MIEIASPAAPQLESLFCRCEHGRREKYDPIADREHSIATFYPSKSSLIIIPTARQIDASNSQIPIGCGTDALPTAVSFLEGFERRRCLGGR